MKCLTCGEPIPFPTYGRPAVCVPCDKRYPLIADLGWWGYTVEVYAAEP